MPYATASDGVRLYYEERGAGDPLLLVSGQASDHTGWDTVRDGFADKYRVIVFDHRGTGLSDKPATPPYSTRGFADDAIALLDHLQIPRAHAYGVSMGGRICQWLGITYPERLGGLILGCTTPGNAHGVPRPADVDELFKRRAVDPVGATRALLETTFTPHWIDAHPDVVAKVLNISTTPPFAQQLHYIASEGHDSWDLLPTIKAPTLVIHGSDDRINPTANADLLASRIPHAEVYIVQGGRHGYFVEFEAEVNRVIKDFLGRHPL